MRKPISVMVRALLDHGAQVNDQDNYGWTPLYIASRFCFYEDGKDVTLPLLLECGADPNIPDHAGQTPLMWRAVWNNNYDSMLLLITYGAKVEAKDNEGKTALRYALDWFKPRRRYPGARKIISFLRKYSAK